MIVSIVQLQIVELPSHPFFIGAQFHPEFKSRPGKPSPLFLGIFLPELSVFIQIHLCFSYNHEISNALFWEMKYTLPFEFVIAVNVRFWGMDPDKVI